MRMHYIAAILAFGLIGGLMLRDASDKSNPYGDAKDPKKYFKVHFDQTKFPDLPKVAYASQLRCYKNNCRAGQVWIILEDGRRITTTYSNIAVEE